MTDRPGDSRPGAPSADEVRDFIVAEAGALGFHRVGVAPVAPPLRYDAYRAWIDGGQHGTMAYMAAPDHVACRADLRRLLADARTAVVVALAYPGGDRADPDPATAIDDNGAPTPQPGAPTPETGTASRPNPERRDPPRGFVARYARGADYHGVIKRRLRSLAAAIGEFVGRPVAARPCVDSAPVLERDLAEAAGIGFTAKNTMTIAPGLGSYFVLGELLLDVVASATASRRDRPRCGTCRACLDACPTGAFPAPYVLDARRCVSYLTIEHSGPIPDALRPALGAMIFGCDICQDVCPFNARAPDRVAADPELAGAGDHPGVGAPDLLALLAQGSNQRKRWSSGRALRRVNREQLLRNVCVALGNAGDDRAVAPLAGALGDRSAVVRGHAAWALGRLGAASPLRAALAAEADPAVQGELRAAIERCEALPRSDGAGRIEVGDDRDPG